MITYSKTKKEAERFIKLNKEKLNMPIVFYYKDKNEYIVINNISFDCKELRFKTEKEAKDYCKKEN